MSILNKKKKKPEATTVTDTQASKEADKKPAKEKKEVKSSAFSTQRDVLVRPLISEKGTAAQEYSKYIFEVITNASKVEIQQAVEALYKVDVIKVNVLNQQGKKVRFGRVAGKRRNWKKAVVTLKKGQRITPVEGV